MGACARLQRFAETPRGKRCLRLALFIVCIALVTDVIFGCWYLWPRRACGVTIEQQHGTAQRDLKRRIDELSDAITSSVNGARELHKYAKPVMGALSSDETIFVSVASFRDSECPPTVEDLFAKAKNPRRLFIGIIEQNDPSDPPCMPPAYASCQGAEFCPSDNIRIRRVRPSEARGPTFGRYVAMLMYQGEKYYMMIDSHNRFSTHWDAKLIKMYETLPSKKAVISTYPDAWLNDSKQSLDNNPHITFICWIKWVDDAIPQLAAFMIPKGPPRLQPYAAAGFLFADAQLVKEVPFDPYLDYIFDGEEITYSVRMWTHGWDIYTPSQNLIYHYYLREGAHRVWSVPNNNWYPVQRESQKRVLYILGITKANTSERIVPLDSKEKFTRELDKYGLGTERTIEQYWKFAKTDPVHRSGAQQQFCSF